MKAPSPPPTIPRRIRASALSRPRPSIGMLCPLFLSNAQHAPVGREVRTAGGEVVERALRDLDDVIADEDRTFARTLLGILDAAFPLQHRPALEAVLRELGEDAAEVDLAVAQRAEASRAVDPGLEPAIDAGAPVRVQLGVLHVEHLDPL